MKKFLKKRAWDIVLASGATLVSAGVAMIYLPAGLIAGGLLVIVGGILGSLGGGGHDR